MTIEEKNREIENAEIFLDFIQMHGFNPEKYRKILEIGNSPDTSMSRMLKKYKPFLLSYMISKRDLKKARIHGMPGDIENGRIVYPDQKASEEAGLKSRIAESPTHPSLKRFDVIISRGVTKKAFDTVGTPQDKFIGFCLDRNDPSYEFNLLRTRILLDELNKREKDEYELVTNDNSASSKGMCLIKRKGIN